MRALLEEPQAPLGCSFRCLLRAERAFAFSWHHHAEWELTCIVAGRGTRTVGGGIDAIRARELVLIGPHLPHTWHAPPGRRPHRAVVIQIPRPLMEQLRHLPELAALAPLLTAAAERGVILDARTRPELVRLLMRMPQDPPAERLAGLIRVLGTLPSLARHARALAPRPGSQRTGSAARSRLTRLQELLAGHLDQDQREAFYARALGMSAGGFSRFVHRATGTTFVRFRQQVRLRRACTLLESSEEAITAIAFGVGFNTLSHFNRVFRSELGTTPRAYRARFR